MVQKLFFISLTLIWFSGCSDFGEFSSDSKSDKEWSLDPLLQKRANPILSVSVRDSQLLVIDSYSTSLLDSFLDSSRYGITLNGYNIGDNVHKPIHSNQFVYSFARDEEVVLADGYVKSLPEFPTRVELNFRDADTIFSRGYSIETMSPRFEVGAVSEDDYLLVALTNKMYVKFPWTSRMDSLCNTTHRLIFSRLQVSGDEYSPKLNVEYLKSLIFDVPYVNSVKYWNQHFYVATDNGVARFDKDGSNLRWFLHLETECSVGFPDDEFLVYYTREDRKVFNDLWRSNSRHDIIDVAFIGDTIVALEKYGTLWVSTDNGESWKISHETSLFWSCRLFQTPSMIGAIYLSEIYKIDLATGSLIEIDNRDISNLMINDVAEFQGRFYMATDGGLYSKKLEDL